MAKGQPRYDDLSGKIFARLTVTTSHEIRGRCRVYWLCSCSCGNTKWVISDALKSGATRSCGCFNDETRRVAHKPGAMKDGKHSPEYTTWHSMKQRCANPNNKKYHLYGGRGITVCHRWLKDFSAFLEDMGPRPGLHFSIDRINSNGNYEPSNCRWATSAEQSRNLCRNRMITFRGETMCIEDWRKRTGIPHATLHYRLNNWSVERALTEPLK